MQNIDVHKNPSSHLYVLHMYSRHTTYVFKWYKPTCEKTKFTWLLLSNCGLRSLWCGITHLYCLNDNTWIWPKRRGHC